MRGFRHPLERNFDEWDARRRELEARGLVAVDRDRYDAMRAVERAARRYYERYCQDEADGSEWVCGEEQRQDAQALRDALRATE